MVWRTFREKRAGKCASYSLETRAVMRRGWWWALWDLRFCSWDFGWRGDGDDGLDGDAQLLSERHHVSADAEHRGAAVAAFGGSCLDSQNRAGGITVRVRAFALSAAGIRLRESELPTRGISQLDRARDSLSHRNRRDQPVSRFADDVPDT